jgi:hypothetical protein
MSSYEIYCNNLMLENYTKYKHGKHEERASNSFEYIEIRYIVELEIEDFNV